MANKRNAKRPHVNDGTYWKRKQPCRWQAKSKDAEGSTTQSIEIDTNDSVVENSVVDAAESTVIESSVMDVVESTSVENSVVDATESIVVESSVMDVVESTSVKNSVVDAAESIVVESSVMDVVESTSVENSETTRVAIDGARIVNIEQLGKYIKELSSHVAQCKKRILELSFCWERRGVVLHQ